MAIGPSTIGSLRRPPSRTLDPLDPTAIIEDTEQLPVLASNVNQLEAEPPPLEEPLALEPSPVIEETPARRRLKDLVRPPINGRTAPTVVGPAQRAVAAAIDRTGADLPRPPAAPAPEQLDPVQPAPAIGMTVAEIRAATRQHAALQREASRKLRDVIQPVSAPEMPVVDRSLRSMQPDADESIAADNGFRVATGEGGGLFARHPELIKQAEAVEKVQDVPEGEGFEPIRNLFRGLAAGGLGLGESTGTILRYLGGETGLESVAALGENIEAFFQPRMRAFAERAAQTFRADQNIFDNPELLLDPDFLTFTFGQIIPSLLATITPVGLGRAAVRKLALSSLAKKTAGAVGAVGAAAEEGRRVALTAKQITALGKAAGKADSAGKFSQFVKIGNKAIDLTDPLVLAKLTRIGKAANAAGFAAGGISGGALEGSSTYRETLDTLIEQGVPEDVARETAENAFLMMTAGSGVLNSIGLQRIMKLIGGQASGIKARTLVGLQEALTEWLEGPLEAAIQLGQETITPEQAVQKIKDEFNVLPAAFLTAFMLPGAGGQLGMASDRTKPPAQSAADTTQEGEPGDLPDVDPGAGPAGQAVNVTTEEASATAQAEAEEVDETTVQEPDEGEAAAGEAKKAPAAPTPAKPEPSPAPEPEPEVVELEELQPEDEAEFEPEPTPEELAFDEARDEPTADDILNARAALATDEDGEFEISKQTVKQLKTMADEFGVKKTGNKAALVTRITDAAADLVAGRDVAEVPSAQAIPETEDQVQVGGAVAEGVGREGGEDLQQQEGRAVGGEEADREGGEPRAAEAGKKVKRKPSKPKPVAKTAKEKAKPEATRIGATGLGRSTVKKIVEAKDTASFAKSTAKVDLQAMALRLEVDESGSKIEIAKRVRDRSIELQQIDDTAKLSALSTSDRIKAVLRESEQQVQQSLDTSLLSATAAAAPQDFIVSEDKKALDIMSVAKEGHRISYMAARKRGGTQLQIIGASVREPSQNRGIGQQLIVKMHELATSRDLFLVSDTTVSSDQLRAYMGLRRKGWEIVFADEVQVKDILAQADAKGTTQFLALLNESIVISVRSPQQQEDELTLGEPQQGVLFSAEGGRGGTAERVAFTPEEKQQVEKVAAQVEPVHRPAVRQKIREDRQKFPPSEGWVRMEPTKVNTNKKGEVTSISYKQAPFSFEKDPATGKPFSRAKAQRPKLEKRKRHLANKLVAEVRVVEKAARRGAKWAKDILAQRAWYTAVTARLRNEFGGAADLVADLLGATSPKTPTGENFKSTIDAARQLSQGKFDKEMRAFVDHLETTGTHKGYKGPVVNKINGTKFGINSPRTMLAMAKVWREVRPLQAPKARNFTGNLIGFSDLATIDVWAARFLDRMARTRRVPPKAEAAVRGKVDARGEKAGGQFGFAQDVFDIAAADLNMTPKDLQAVAWFLEKREWFVKNKWTTEEGAGGSFDKDLADASLSRVTAGISIKQERQPTKAEQNKISVRMKNFFQADPGSVVFRMASSLGLYNGDAERSFDIEATVEPDFNVDSLVQELAKIGQENNQTDVFVSRVLSPTANNVNARPGIEVFFKGAKTLREVQPILDSLVADGIDGFTMVVDPRARLLGPTTGGASEAFIGVRYQFVPEIKARYDSDFVADIRDRGMDAILEEQSELLDAAAEKLLQLGASHVEVLQYDTIVFGQENYGDYTTSDRTQDQEAGRVWFGQSVATAVEAAVGRHQTGAATGAGASVRGGVQQTTAEGAGESLRADTGRPRNRVQGTGEISSPPVREDGRVELKHWSHKDSLDELDPAFHGTGLTGEESKRKRNNGKHWIDRTYYGIGVGINGGYTKERGLGSVEYTASVEPDQLYDFQKDANDFHGQATALGHQGETLFTVEEAMMEEAGFAGYWVKNPSLGIVAAVFDKLNTEVSDGRPDTTTQAAATGQSTAGQISAAADNQLAGDASTVAAPARPASTAEGAAEQLSDPTADSVLFSADDRLSTVTDPKDRGKKPKTPLKADQVRFHILGIISKLSSLINIRVVQSHNDLPNQIQLRMTRDDIATVRGVYMPDSNTLYIVADSAVSLAGAERTILHEAFGHFAMSSLPQFAAIKVRLQKIIDSNTDQVINDLVKSVKAKGHVSGDQFLDEVIAEMSETLTSRNAALKEVIALVKEMVRALGFNVEMNNNDIMALIRASSRRIERRALAAAGFGIDRSSDKYADFLNSDNLKNLRKATTDQEIGIALEQLADEFDVVLFSASAPMTTELDAEWAKKMNTPLRELSWHDRLKKSMQIFHDMSFDELTQGLLDSANAQKVDEIRLYGQVLDASVSSHKAMSTIRNMNNVMGAVMRHGIPALTEKFIKLADGTQVKGLNFTNPKDGQAFQEIFTPLQKIGGDSQLRNWEKWVVATRANRIIAEDKAATPPRTGKQRREKLIEQELIDKTLQWAKDHTAENGQTYEEVFKEVQDNWQKVNKANLDLAVTTGVVDAAERKIWEQYDYIPFWREMSALESGRASGRGSRTDVSSAGLFRLTGSVDRDGSPTRLEGNVVDSMFMNTAYLLERSYRNEAMRRTKDVGVQTGSMIKEPQVARPQRIPNVKADDLIKMLFNSGMISAETEEDAIAVFNGWSKTEKDKWLTFFNRVKPPGDDIVTVMEKGKPVYYRVTDRLLLKSIVGMQGKNIGMWMSAMRTSKKWLTIGVTTDPAFMIANWMRDTVQTFVVSRAPLHSLADPIKSIAEAFNDSPAMLALAFAGRGGGGFYDTNPEKIRDLLKDMGVPGAEVGGFMSTIVSPRKLFRFWKRIGTASEFGNRVRVYNSLKLVWDKRIAELGQRGIKGQDAVSQAVSEGLATPEEAAFQAQDLLNFTRSGDFVAIQNLIQIIPFLNARLQGINKLWRGARESPLAFTTKGGALMAVSLSIAIANDDDDRYNDLAEWDKDTYYHFWIQDQHWRLPKPFESGVLFSTIPERIWRAGKGIDGWDEFSRSMLHAALDTFAFNPIPQLVKPWMESYFNTNIFTSTPIIPAGMENLLPQRQYDWRTGEFSRWVGDAMPDFMPDVMQSPKRIEHLMRGYFGALGVYAMSVANVMTDSILHGPERALGEISALRLHEIPVVKRFKQADTPHTTKYNRIMWEMVREADAVSRTIKKYLEEGEGHRALGLARDEQNLIALRPTLRRIATQVSAVNNQLNQIALDRRLSPERRATLRDKLLKQRNALTKQIEPLLEYL